MSEAGSTTPSETARGTVERVEPTKAQRAVARRVAESKATAPHLYADAEAAVANAGVEQVVHAVARALRDHPRMNGAYRDGAFETYSRVNVGVVVETGEATTVPTIFDADEKEPSEIAAELERLGERATTGELTSPELAGGTFTVLHTAAGIRSLTPVLNQGQAGALAAVAGSALTATLACDARMIAPTEAAAFLDRVRALLEGAGG